MKQISRAMFPKLFPLLLILITVVLGGGIVISSYINHLDIERMHKSQVSNVTTRVVIGAAVMSDLQKLETLFYKLAMAANPQQKHTLFIFEDAQKSIAYIHHLLDILEKGGTVAKDFPLSIIGRKELYLEIPYKVPPEHHYILEVLELRPGVMEIEEKMKQLMEVTRTRNQFISNPLQNHIFRKESLKIRAFIKKTEPLFLRMTENASKLYFDGEKALLRLQQQLTREYEIEKQNELYRTSISAAIILFFIGIAFRQIFLNWKSLEDQVAERTNELLISKEEWEKTFDAIPDLITLQDKNKKIVRANQATFDFFKMKPEELLSKTCYQLFKGSSQLCSDCPSMTVPIDGKKHVNIIENKELDTTFQVTSALVLDDNNAMQYIVYIAQDVTEIKKLEKELTQAQKMQAVGTLAGGIAHDFNNILAAILGYAEIIKSNIPQNSVDEKYLNRLIAAGNRATELVKQILTFSRSSSQKSIPLRMDLIVKETIKMMRASLPTNIALETVIASQIDLIMADPTNIHQIIVNLCTNASHAIGKENGTIKVELSRINIDPDQLVGKDAVKPGLFNLLTVKDTGRGMDNITMQRSFEPYFTTKKQGEGSGLGLAITHGIVAKCHGFITVESVPEEGSTFNIFLPCIEENIATSQGDTDVNPHLTGGTEHILIVNDETDIIEIENAYLTQLGYRVTRTTKSLEALAIFRAAPESFDLVITDQTMPDLCGDDLARAMLALRPSIPIILCSGYTSTLSEEEAYEIGIKCFIAKPLSQKFLSNAVRRVLDENS